MTTYVLDTNIVSYILRGEQSVAGMYRAEGMKGNEFVLPPVVRYEIIRGLLAKAAMKKLENFEKFCENFDIVEINTPVWHKAAEIYAHLQKMGKSREDADILIAAFCIVNGYTLVTNNTKHFRHVDNLKLVNWK